MLLLTLREELLCIIILIFLIFYYVFNKVKDREMLFLKLSLISLLHVILDIATVITVNSRDTVPDSVNRLLHILFYISGLLFAIWFYNYIVHISVLYRHARFLKGMGYVVLVCFSVLLAILPMEYVQGKGTYYSYGLLAIVGYGLFLLYCTASLILLLCSRKQLESRTRWALIPILFIMYIGVIMQAVVPELLMTGGNVTLICIGLFVALDNPDRDFMRQAMWDFSTGLKNRNCYNRDLDRYTEQLSHGKGKRKHQRIGFLVADLNYLKDTNDCYGHAEGDRLIAAAAAVLQENLRLADNVYRLGGDEFAAIYRVPNDEAVAEEMDRVYQACKKADGFAVPLSLALGYASGSMEEGMESIFQRADEKMYQDKARIKETLPHPVSH